MGASISIILGAAGGGATVGAAWAAVAYRARARMRELMRQLHVAQHSATHDPLTGLSNRVAFYQAASSVVAEPAGRRVAVVLLDLDRFKQVNDAYGHGVGDLVLVAVAHRLRKLAGEHDLIARLGGDEFAVVLTSPTDVATGGLDVVLAALRDVAREPVALAEGVAVSMTASVGVTHVSGPSDLGVLLGQADAAMYRAKRDLLGVAVYDPLSDHHMTPISGVRPAVRTRDLPRGDGATTTSTASGERAEQRWTLQRSAESLGENGVVGRGVKGRLAAASLSVAALVSVLAIPVAPGAEAAAATASYPPASELDINWNYLTKRPFPTIPYKDLFS